MPLHFLERHARHVLFEQRSSHPLRDDDRNLPSG